MLSSYDESELLALIEGELDPEAETALRDRLASDPEVGPLVAAMVRDRTILKSEPEPPFPFGLSNRIEQALARPMLIAAWGEDAAEGQPVVTRPGEFRRRHNRIIRRRRIIRMSLAASVSLMLLGGLWMGINAAFNLRSDREQLIAQSSPEMTPDAAAGTQHSAPEPWPPAGSIVHHYAPHPVLETHLAKGATEERLPAREARSEPVAVHFALLIRSGDTSASEAHLETLIAAIDSSAALVQNFSFEEAVRLEEQWRLARAGTPRVVEPPMQAGVGTGRSAPQPRMRDVADRALEQLREIARETAAPAVQPSRQLAGPRDLAASFAQQLEYSSRGATHTITIRLSQLQAFLEQVDDGSTGRAALRPLPEEDVRLRERTRDRRRPAQRQPDAREADALWLQSRAAVREAIAALEATGEDPLILLPVVIE